MGKKFIYCVRVVGAPANRRYLIQRSDGGFLGGEGKWVAEPHQALVYRTIADAQADCRPLMDRQKKGKPRRRFTCSLTVTVIGHGTAAVTAEDVVAYLEKVLHIGIDYEVFHDGPVGRHTVEVTACLGGLVEQPD
jgi:hypothetical protein